MIAALLWVVLAVVLAVAEAFTGTLVLLMFAAGALAAAAAAGLGGGLLVQAITFAVVSVLSAWLLRPIIRKHFIPAIKGEEDTFGVKALEGAAGVVLEQVTDGAGLVRVEGEVWSARSYDATQVIDPDERIRVVELRGTTAMVWRDEFEDVDVPDEP